MSSNTKISSKSVPTGPLLICTLGKKSIVVPQDSGTEEKGAMFNIVTSANLEDF